jgi:pilus assembly protein CpaB
MNVKKFAPLLIALVMGLCAVFVAMNMMSKKGGTAIIKRNQVVVALRPVDAGSALTDEDLTTMDIAGDAVPDTAFKSPADLLGRVTEVPLIANQVITATVLAPKNAQPGLAAIVPGGMRAVTLDINEITGVAGFLLPGSHVDVIQTFHDMKTGYPVTKTIVQNVQVSAIGTRRNPNDPNDTGGGGHSATVFVTPEQAELLELASSVGRQRLALRNGNDLSPAMTKGASLAELIGDEKPDSAPVVTPVEMLAPTTQEANPLAAIAVPTTQPVDEQWTVVVVKADSESKVKFELHQADQQDSAIEFNK